MSLVTNELGTVLGQAIHRGSTEIAFLLLEHGADVIHVGRSCSTASGAYPTALDVAGSGRQHSRPNPTCAASASGHSDHSGTTKWTPS